MDLRRATLWLIVGSVYTVLHKAAHGLVPALGRSPAAGAVALVLWFAATFALILFAYQFLREVRPADMRLRYSLISVIVLTGLVMVSKLPLLSMSEAPVGHRLLFDGASMLNSIALLVFTASLSRLIDGSSPLGVPLRLLVWGLGLTVVLGLVGAGYWSVYLVTGREVEPLRILQPLAMLSFVFTYGVTLWFLVRFWRLGSYGNVVRT
jgi:hypothetical protein